MNFSCLRETCPVLILVFHKCKMVIRDFFLSRILESPPLTFCTPIPFSKCLSHGLEFVNARCRPKTKRHEVFLYTIALQRQQYIISHEYHIVKSIDSLIMCVVAMQLNTYLDLYRPFKVIFFFLQLLTQEGQCTNRTPLLFTRRGASKPYT